MRKVRCPRCSAITPTKGDHVKCARCGLQGRVGEAPGGPKGAPPKDPFVITLDLRKLSPTNWGRGAKALAAATILLGAFFLGGFAGVAFEKARTEISEDLEKGEELLGGGGSQANTSGDTRDIDVGSGPDRDNDGVADSIDNCLLSANRDQSDIDGDGRGDVCDDDRDGDGVNNTDDAFPDDANETTDSDGDGTGDNADAFPEDANETADGDGDGVGDNSDNCPDTANADQADADGDGTGDACEESGDSGGPSGDGQEPDPIVVQGSGDYTSPSASTTYPLLHFELEYWGDSFFGVKVCAAGTSCAPSDGREANLLAEDLGNYFGTRVVALDPGEYYLKVDADDGTWSITITQPRPDSGATTPATRNGNGDEARGPFEFEGDHEVRFQASGIGEITVRAYTLGGAEVDGCRFDGYLAQGDEFDQTKTCSVGSAALVYFDIYAPKKDSGSSWTLTLDG